MSDSKPWSPSPLNTMPDAYRVIFDDICSILGLKQFNGDIFLSSDDEFNVKYYAYRNALEIKLYVMSECVYFIMLTGYGIEICTGQMTSPRGIEKINVIKYHEYNFDVLKNNVLDCLWCFKGL
jgi:hypothetical protein